VVRSYKTNMKSFKQFIMAIPLTSALALPLAARAEDKPATKAKEYPLKTCVVSGEKLGEMGDPYAFTHDGQEIKLCCKSCKKKFDKDPETYMKKLKDAPAKK